MEKANQMASAEKQSDKKSNKIRSIKYSDIFWIIFLGSILGFILEGIWSMLKSGQWENHSATVWGPFCLVYGIGAVVIYLLAAWMDGKNVLIQYVVYAIAGSAVEYLISLFQEITFGSKSWDYSGYVMNFGGRVRLQLTLIWGVLGLAFVYFAYHPLQKLFAKYDGKSNRILVSIFTIFMVVNLAVSALAVWRWAERRSGIEPRNRLEVILDERFDDNRMEKIYSNMEFIE